MDRSELREEIVKGFIMDVFIEITDVKRRSHGDFVEDVERLSTDHRVNTIGRKSESHFVIYFF